MTNFKTPEWLGNNAELQSYLMDPKAHMQNTHPLIGGSLSASPDCE